MGSDKTQSMFLSCISVPAWRMRCFFIVNMLVVILTSINFNLGSSVAMGQTTAELVNRRNEDENNPPIQPTVIRDQLEHAVDGFRENDLLFEDSLLLIPRLKERNDLEGNLKADSIQLFQEVALGSSDLSTEIGLLSSVLVEEFFRYLPRLEDTALTTIQTRLKIYEQAKEHVKQATKNLREKMGGWKDQDDPLGERHVHQLIDFAMAYKKQQNAFSHAASALTLYIDKLSIHRGPGATIRRSVYGVFDKDKREDKGYGLYTYVLFMHPDIRNNSFFKTLVSTTITTGDSIPTTKDYLNIYYIPTHNRVEASRIIRRKKEQFHSFGNVIGDQTVYDFQFVTELWPRLCASPSAKQLEACKQELRGPYLLTVPQPLSQTSQVPTPFLLVDLSNVPEKEFGEFINVVKEQVMHPDFDRKKKIHAFRLRILLKRFSAGEVLVPIKKGLESILHLSM